MGEVGRRVVLGAGRLLQLAGAEEGGERGEAFGVGDTAEHAGVGWLAAAGLLLAWIVALSWLAARVGLVVKSPERAGGFGFFLLFLPYPSSGFVPIETMPGWLRGFAEHQPVTPLSESVRGLLLGEPAGGAVWRTLAWCFGILVCSVALSGVVFRRRSRRKGRVAEPPSRTPNAPGRATRWGRARSRCAARGVVTSPPAVRRRGFGGSP